MTTRRPPLMDISNNDIASSPAETGARRKSGRAVRAPQKFIPDAPPHTGRAKRKREGDDVENDASDIEDEEEASSDDTGDSSGEEEVREVRRKPKQSKTAKKPAAKKPKVNGTVAHEAAPVVKLPNRPKKAKKVLITGDDDEGLYVEVFASRDSFEDVSLTWLNRYQTNKVAALTELINFVLKCTGCNVPITEDDIEDPDNVEGRLADVQQEYQAQNITDYPLISKGKNAHTFRTSLTGFFEELIMAMHTSGVLYEEPTLIEMIHLWLASMSSSTSRPFRHTSTLAALTVASALCTVASKEIEYAANTLRQLEGEQKKKGANKARLADFRNKVTINEQHKEFVENLIKDYFDTVYVHRYRDVDPKIRTECVEALGNWILTLPSFFLEGQYLRYMGWMLSDSHSAMRQEVLKQLEKIMKDPNSTGGMHHFIERFRPRMVEMASRDSESSVRAAAVALLDLIREAGMLEPDDIDVIGKLIFDSEPKVRKALVGFFAENITDLYESKVDELGGEEVIEEYLTVEDEENFDTPREDWIRLKCLAEILLSYDDQDQEEMPSQIDAAGFLNVSGSESRFTLAAQALHEKVPLLKEWEVLAGYLLFDHTSRSSADETERALKDSFKPDETDELVLLEILTAIVKLSLTQTDDSDRVRDKTKKKHLRMETSDAKETTARRLAEVIPRLLKKFGADPKTATAVLRLEHVLNLGVFQDLRQGSTAYAELLDEISRQFSGHADKAVLSEAGAALLHARGFEELEDVTESRVQALWENTISMLRKIAKTGQVSVRGSLRPKVLTDHSHNLARLEQLSSITSCVEPLETASRASDQPPIQTLLDIVARGVFEEGADENLDELEDEVVVSAMRSSLFYFMWKILALKEESVSSGEDANDLVVDDIKERQNTFITNLVAAFSSRSTLDPVRLLGAETLLDTYVLFATLRSISSNQGTLRTLVNEVDPEVQQELTSIFDGLEKQYAKRSKKKLAEPSEDEEPEDLDSEPEDEDNQDATDNERQSDSLKAEKQLCDFAGKLVLAVVAGVIDASGPLKGKLRSRLLRNRLKLGPNFREVLACLDDQKLKGKKSHKGKAEQAATTKKTEKSTERVVEDDEEEDDPFSDVEPEEGTVEDLRRRELLDDEPPDSAEENDDAAAEPEEDDDIMGE